MRVIFEGVDGTGKTTLLAALKERLEADRFRVSTSRRPTFSLPPSPTFDDFTRDAARHLKEVIPPAPRKEIHLQDRDLASQVIYNTDKKTPTDLYKEYCNLEEAMYREAGIPLAERSFRYRPSVIFCLLAPPSAIRKSHEDRNESLSDERLGVLLTHQARYVLLLRMVRAERSIPVFFIERQPLDTLVNIIVGKLGAADFLSTYRF